MQDLLVLAIVLVIWVGTQVVADATTVGMHVDITVIASMMRVWSSVDTIVETALVERTVDPKRVAVGVCWQAMIRNYS